MQERISKQRRAKARKPVAAPGMLSSLHRGWKLGALALLIGCLGLAVYAASQGQSPTVDATGHAPATNAIYAMPTASDSPTAQQTTGIFSLSKGGPIPVPANVFHPTNIARIFANDVLTSIYAGSMTRTPDIGALAILQENLKTGQQSLHIYETAKGVGALTIVGVQGGVMMLATEKGREEFDLGRGVFEGGGAA